MKAISLWQPWASAIALGAKGIETRSWSTPYRGPIAIHAAKRCVKEELFEMSCQREWCAALGWAFEYDAQWERLPFGAIVAVCDLVDCRPIESFTLGEIERAQMRHGISGEWTERQMGDFTVGAGRFGWVLSGIRALAFPIPYRGAQGLFDVEIQS